MTSDMIAHVKKDGSFFSFQTSGGSFEAIFYEEKVVRQFFAGFTNFWTFGETFETIFDEKKVVRQMDLSYGFTFPTFGGLFEAIFYEKKLVLQFF